MPTEQRFQRRASRSISRVITLFLLGLVAVPASAERTAPNGVLVPRRGPYQGKPCPYGDGSSHNLRVAEYTVQELEDFISGKKKYQFASEVHYFLTSLKNREYDYGNQLAKEGYDQYVELVRMCLEDGKVNTKIMTCHHKASQPIGIRLATGKAVTEYRVAFRRGYWIVEPE